jgi:hypothetical protein
MEGAALSAPGAQMGPTGKRDQGAAQMANHSCVPGIRGSTARQAAQEKSGVPATAHTRQPKRSRLTGREGIHH